MDTSETNQRREEGPSNESPTVLIVEDERGLADLYAAWLEDDCTVRTAYGGEQAFEQMDETVDIVLLDRQMPTTSGNDVLEWIREKGYECRIAMVTAVEPGFDIIEMGFDTYLTKPVTGDGLQTVIEQLLALGTYDDQLQEYFILASKKALLDAEKNVTEYEQHDESATLEARLAELQEEVGVTLADIEWENTEIDPLSALLLKFD